MRETLSLPDGPRVLEAKRIVAEALGEAKADPALVPFAMRLAEARDIWANTRKR